MKNSILVAALVAIAISLVGCVRLENKIDVDCQNGVMFYTYTQKSVNESGEDIRIFKKQTGVLTTRDNRVISCNGAL